MAEWQVELSVSGPITTNQQIRFNAEKGYTNPFWTNISVKNASHGVVIILVARADNQTDANDAGLYFVGQALDLLCLEIDLPLYLGLTGTQIRPVNDNVRRIIGLDEWTACFRHAREIGSSRPTYSRALSWYRKGKNSEDPVDAFLSYWSSIEGVGSNFFRVSERNRRGAINQICDCFDQLWGTVENWKVIPNEAGTLNRFHETRNGISHGFIRVDIDTVKSVTQDLPIISALALEFLRDWRRDGVDPEPQRIPNYSL
jgi:hypothetical protein